MARIFIKIVNDSKLFPDGHLRTASLFALSFIPGRYNIQPFCPDEDTAPKFFSISNTVKNIGRRNRLGKIGPIKILALDRKEDQLANFLHKHCHHPTTKNYF